MLCVGRAAAESLSLSLSLVHFYVNTYAGKYLHTHTHPCNDLGYAYGAL